MSIRVDTYPKFFEQKNRNIKIRNDGIKWIKKRERKDLESKLTMKLYGDVDGSESDWTPFFFNDDDLIFNSKIY